MFRRILPLYFESTVPDFDALFGETVFRPIAFNHMFFQRRRQYDVRHALPGLRVPTLILHGRGDCISPITPSAERIHHLLPTPTMVVFEKSGHFPFVEESVLFRRTLEDWLAPYTAAGQPA